MFYVNVHFIFIQLALDNKNLGYTVLFYHSDPHLMQLFPEEIRIVEMPQRPHNQSAVFRCSRCRIDLPDPGIGFSYTVNGEDIVLFACRHYQLPGGYQTGKIPHLKILPDAGDVVAQTVGHGGNGSFVGTHGTAGCCRGDPFIHAGQIVCGRSAAGIAGAVLVILAAGLVAFAALYKPKKKESQKTEESE